MASNSIKGLTVKIGADTSDFIKGLKVVDREINQTQKTANALQKGLKLDYNEKNFLQAQKQVQSALSTTEEKAKAIRQQMQALEKSGNVDTDGYRKLETELSKTETKASQLKQQLEDIDKIKLENATKGAENLSKGLEKAAQKTAVLSAAAVGAIAGINKLAKDAVSSGDTIQTTADQYNLSAEAIQKWNYIALQSDVPADKLYKAMTKSRDAIGTALADGSSTGRAALEALVGDLNNVPTDTEGAFNTVITALAGVKDSTLQAYYANEIFGERVATELIPLLNQGADGLSELSREFEAVGYLTNEQVRSLADYDNELNKVNTRLENAKTQLGLAMIPIMERFVDLLENNVIPAIKGLADWFDSLSAPMQGVVVNGLLLVAALSPILMILSKLIGIIPKFGEMLQWLKTNISQVHIGVGALFASLGLVFGLIENWSKMDNWARIIGVIGTLTTAVLGAAMAFGVFHNAWSLGLAAAGIVAGIGMAVAAINSAKDEIEVPDLPDYNANDYNVTTGNYNIPQSTGNYGSYTDNTSSYVDNSNIVVNIEKNDYMTEDDIIRAVNRGLKQAKQSRT